MADEAPPAVQYRDHMAECQQLMTKIADLESDRNEHILVEDTLKPLDDSRRAYRLVGDVLVERTVAEILPSITQNKNNLDATIEALRDRLSVRQKKAAELKAKHNLGQ
mmetsp:Transcript_108/g.284  ORF Transcript_108/g.284 Transcript_108/m.284 type:complete len:108 (+) Transcript_108:155-478(+)